MAWRDALRVRGEWAPDLIDLLGTRLPEFISFVCVRRSPRRLI